MNTARDRVLCFLTAVVLALAGCGGKDAASYIASAKNYMAKADYKSATIEIKNALQKDPDNKDARTMLAKALLETGNPAGAETEIRKATSLGAPADEAYPLLARALAGQREFKKLTTELGGIRLDTPAARANLAVALAAGHFAQGNVDLAQSALDAALADRPGDADALVMKAQIEARRGNIDAARKFVDQALSSSPDHLEALLIKAEFAASDGKRDEAEKLLDQAIAKHPTAPAPRFAMVSLALRSGKMDAAKAQVAKMKESAPRDFRTLYADALVSFTTGDAAGARDAIQRVLAVAPDNPQSLLLSGLVNSQLGSFAVAEDSLRKVLAKVPNEPTAVRALAAVYLRTGRAPQAVETLGQALKTRGDDPLLLRAAGEAYLAAGNLALATKAYERANALDKSDMAGRVRLAQVRLQAGDAARAFSDLDALSASDSSKYQADLALFSAHLRRHEYDKALAAADAILKKQPASAIPHYLRGIAYLAKRDLKNARASFEKALEIQPDYHAAARSLAIIDIQEGSVEAARDRYTRLLAKYPNNEDLLLGSAEVLRASGASQEKIREALDKAVAANPTSVRARLALVAHSAQYGDAKAAIATTQAALAGIPNDPQLTEALGTYQLASGDANQALETFKRLVQLQPQNPLALLRLAQAQSAAKDYTSAIDSERKALALRPDLAASWTALAKTHLASGKPDAALAEARKVQKDFPEKAFGYMLEGEIYAAQKKWGEAAKAYEAAMARQPSSLLVAKQYAALVSAGKSADATATANKWTKAHPDDATISLLLAQQSQQKKDYATASAGYRRVLEIDSDNVVALNNLAWILAEQKDPKAIEYAEEAHRLSPFNANVLDTLGWTVTRSGDPKRGVQLLRMASNLSPRHAEIRLHLAQALNNAGDKTGARRELTELTKLAKDSPVRIEAEKLLATL
jgi:putative PEP-CTERM system TPR-repeat lipoprotein